MASANELLYLLNCTIRFNTPEGEYEGVIRKVLPNAEIIVIGKLILLPDHRMGSLNFRFSELENMRVISRLNSAKEGSTEKKKHISPVYPKTEIEKLFDFDEGSDIEDVESRQAEYEMKLVPHLSKFVPKDFEIIDTFNKDFSSAIKHIRKQDAIGVSLEGIKVSRSGTLTWLCISTPCCNLLFDILALGKSAFQKGLKSVLENAKIQKIFHDCRLASDCLYHQYGVRLVNVFDTQVADFIFMMQMIQKEKIDNRVNTLDACLNYYLEVPCDYLYGDVNFDDSKDSLNFHALRPLQHEIQDILIKNVMYLHLLKRELELALLTPLRRATDVYLNSVQKLIESELLLVPYKPDELPLDMHLEGIQIFRYKDFEYASSTVASGPPYRQTKDPIKKYVNYYREYKNDQKVVKDAIMNKETSQNTNMTSSELNYKASANYQKARKLTSMIKPVGLSYFNRSSENSKVYSEDTEKNPNVNLHEVVDHKFNLNPSLRVGMKSDESVNLQSIVKSEATPYSEYDTVKNPIIRGLLKLLSKTSNEVPKNATSSSDKSSGVNICNSEISSYSKSVDKKSLTGHSSDTNKLSNFRSACNPPVSDMLSKTKTSQLHHPTLGRKSQSEILDFHPKMRSSESLTVYSSSDESSANGSITTSELIYKKTCEKESNKIDNTVEKKEETFFDSDLEEVASRVRARGALLRNCKTACSASDNSSACDTFSRAQSKFKEIDKTSLGNAKPTSEDVTIVYSDVLKNPSQFVATVNHKSNRLIDLYKKAGDGSFLWTEEDSETVPDSSRTELNESAANDNFWASVLGDRSCEPMDEKLRSRLIPAGMLGY